jgi:hypothetical protein
VLERLVPLAKAAENRRPGNAPQPDSVFQRIAIAIGFGHARNHGDPRSEPATRIKPKLEPDVRLDLEPKPEGEPQAQPEADVDAEAVANSNAESLPDLNLVGLTQCLAEHGAAVGRHRDYYWHSLHAQQVRHPDLLQERHSHRYENGADRVRR